jgi:conjugal transfer ATP-binding protein TraC
VNRHSNVGKKLPFFHFEDQTMVYLDGSLGVGFKLGGADISCASPDAINSLCQKIENFLVGLPERLRIQVFYRLTNRVAETIEIHKAASGDSDPQYQPIREARFRFLERKMENGQFFLPEIYVFVRSEPLQMKKRRFFEKKEQFEGFPEKEFLAHKDRFSILVSQVESALRSANLGPKPLGKDEWFGLCFSYLNFERSEMIGTPVVRDPLEPLNSSLGAQLALTDISVNEKHLEVGDRFFRVVTLALLPEGETFASMIEGLSKLPFHFWLSQNIKTLEQRKEIEKLELMRRIANSMASGSQNVSDIESESKLSSLEDLLREVMTGSERLVTSDLNVIFWADAKDELERKTEEILRAFRSMGQAEGLAETFALEDAFFKAAPSICEGFRHKRMKTSNCAHLMPLYASWMGNKRPVVLLSNREGAPFSIDPFAPELPNWNGLVFGGSGAGKSFTISQLMLQFCGQTPKPKIVWIDNGASSEKLIEVMDGEFIDLNLESGIRLNMFDLDEGETKPSSSKIKLILGCLELILKDEDKPGLPKREKGLLEEAIFACYRETEGSTPTLSVLKEVLRNHSVVDMRKHADILFSWTGETAFGKMLDGQSNVKLTKDLVAIEIKGLENYRDLKDIFLLLLTSYIKNEAASDLSRPYLLIIDEAQRLFKGSPMGKEFAIDSFRVFRKYNGGIWCISQNYKDFLSDPDLADSLMPNTTFVFILRQRKIDWEDFKETFDFNDAQVEAVKNLDIVKGKYSELFFMQDENQAVLRLEPEPLSYWICTTDGNDKAKVADLRAKDPSRPLIEILSSLSKGETY